MTTGRLDFLYPNSDAYGMRKTCGQLALKAASCCAPRWGALPQAALDLNAFQGIVQEPTLHWMYISAIHHPPPQIGDPEWEHPQTRPIVHSAVKRNRLPGSAAETLLCARRMGLSEAEYLRWREADDAFLGMLKLAAQQLAEAASATLRGLIPNPRADATQTMTRCAPRRC